MRGATEAAAIGVAPAAEPFGAAAGAPRRAALALSIALVSAAALGYQLLLMRLLAIVHWYPFAAMIVSLALLGHGVSGSLLALGAGRVRARFVAIYVAAAVAFALAAPLAFALAQRVPFNGLELIWDGRQVAYLAAIYLLLGVPFLAAASCFGASFVAYGARIPRLYAADLIGAGVGAVAILALIELCALATALRVLALAGLGAALLALLAARRGRAALLLGAFGAALLLALPDAWLTAHVNPFKGLSKALLIAGTRVVEERSSALALVTAIESPRVPLRHVPGLSLAATQEPVAQIGLYSDGDGLSVISARGDDPAALAYLGQTTAALPYALRAAPRVLVLGAGGGGDVLQALTLGARAVVAVELDPNRVELVRTRFADFAGHLYDDPRVRVVVGDARHALRSERGGYDLIVWPLADSTSGAGGGVQAAADSFLYTVEAVREGHARLAPGGYLVATRWETLPPRDSAKLFATFVAALRAEGVTEPGRQLAAIRGWQTSTLLLKRGALEAGEITAIAAFAARLGFDPVWYPGLTADLANRHHLLERPYLYEAARALAGRDAAAFIAAYKFDLEPATDARPFFHDLFRWRALPELWRLRERGAAPLLESGYLVMVAALLQALPLALLLIGLPLLGRGGVARAPGRARALLYFGALGLGFLFVEIAALSRASLYVGHPLLATALVLATLLIGAGLGSATAARWVAHPRAIVFAALAVALLLIGAELAWSLARPLAAEWPLGARAAAAALALLPLAFAMGLPFPLGLARLAAQAPALVAWAWGINGCTSVLSALLAVLLAIELGYGAVVLAAAALYALAAALAPR
jgi:SAM-dependent methyltransferase